MKRRTFLKNTSALSLLSMGWSNQALANMVLPRQDDHFFVLIRMGGGWDVTLCLDPRTHITTTQDDIFLEYQEAEIIKHKALALGPACLPIKKYMDSIHVIKGIEMRRDAGHLTNLDIISCGYGDGNSALFPVELAATLKSGPLGVLIDRGIPTGHRKPILTEISKVANNQDVDLIDILTGGDSSTFDEAIEAAKAASQKMQEIAKISKDLEQQGLTDSSHRSIAAAFKARASYQASIELPSNLDTHSDHEGTHLNALTAHWEQVAQLFDAFQKTEFENGESLFDRTTFMVVSEFARTPALNGSKGKDHNPHANSVMLVGRGIRGGASIGETIVISAQDSQSGLAEHISRPIDYKTGEVVDNSSNLNDKVNLIFPEDVAKTLGAVFGSPQGFYATKEQGWVIPGVLT